MVKEVSRAINIPVAYVRKGGFNSEKLPDATDGIIVVPVVDDLMAVAEPLAPRIVIVVGRGRPVPASGIRTTSVSMAIF
jgi:hypothetical protein